MERSFKIETIYYQGKLSVQDLWCYDVLKCVGTKFGCTKCVMFYFVFCVVLIKIKQICI